MRCLFLGVAVSGFRNAFNCGGFGARFCFLHWNELPRAGVATEWKRLGGFSHDNQPHLSKGCVYLHHTTNIAAPLPRVKNFCRTFPEPLNAI